MSRPIPVCVIGCGHLGTFHARLYRSLPEADLRMVMDVLPEKARALGESLETPWTADLDEALRACEAVSVATPTVTHEEVAARCLTRGCHVLVEKPLAAHPSEGERLVRLARERNRLLSVGHVERFNPAYQAARLRVSNPRFIEAHRLATFVPRSLDVDVVLDLMIHDLDLALDLVGRPVENLDAVGVPVLTDGEDIANARVRFQGGCIANLTASRVSRERVRKIRLFGQRRYVSVDLAERRIEEVILEEASAGGEGERGAERLASLWASRPEEPEEPDPADDTGGGGSPAELLSYFAQRRLRVRHDRSPLQEANPLQDELRDFLSAAGGETLRGASGEAGLQALRLAFEVREKVRASLSEMELPTTGS